MNNDYKGVYVQMPIHDYLPEVCNLATEKGMLRGLLMDAKEVVEDYITNHWGYEREVRPLSELLNKLNAI